MPEMNVKVYRLLLGQQNDALLDIKLAEESFHRALEYTRKVQPAFYSHLEERIEFDRRERGGVKLDYWSMAGGGTPETLKYFAQIHSRANHTAGLCYSEASIQIGEPDIGRYHQVVMQLPQDEQLYYHIKSQGLDNVMLYQENIDHQKIGWAAGDIRQALAGYSGKRLGVLLAGSQGWDNPSQIRARSFRLKNEGLLPATINDCNSMFQYIHALSQTNYLHGAVLAGLVRKKEALLDLMAFLRNRDFRTAERHLLDQKNVEGTLYIDSEVPGHVIKGGILYNYRQIKRSDGSSPHISGVMKGVQLDATIDINCERLVGEITGWVPNDVPKGYIPGNRAKKFDVPYLVELDIPFVDGTFDSDYAVLYYSGHGTPQGQMTIERESSLTPQELANACQKSNLSLLLILDMCYAGRFADEFITHMKRYGLKSVVMCSVDCSSQQQESFECEASNDMLGFLWPIDIQRSDISYGRGVYTTALGFGLLCIRELEMQQGGYFQSFKFGAFSGLQGKPVVVSIQDFNDRILAPVCNIMSTSFGLPLQKPVVYNS